MMNAKFIKETQNKLKKIRDKHIITSTSKCNNPCNQCWLWLWTVTNLDHEAEKLLIPKDVPKGHMAVYVGGDHKRFVVELSLLKHPLFVELLDQARDQHDDSTTPTKLWIPCDELVFAHVLRCARKLGLGRRIVKLVNLC